LRFGSGAQYAEDVLSAGNAVGIGAQRTFDLMGKLAPLV
jgi:hypothetical protein